MTDVFNTLPPRQFKQDQSFVKQLGAKLHSGKWVLVLDKIYVLQAGLYDSEGHQITLTENLVFESEIDKTYFEVLSQNSIGSELLVRVRKDINLEKAAKTVVKTYLDKIKEKYKDSKPYAGRKI